MTSSRTVKELQRKLEEAERRQAEAEGRLEPTTFGDFIQGCHQFLTVPLEIQSNLNKSTKGSITRPDGRLCPTFLCKWEDFPLYRSEYFEKITSLFHSSNSPLYIFESRAGLQALGNHHCRRPLASELDLMGYQRYAVEEHVITVIQELLKIGPNNQIPFLGSGISFENHANTLTEPTAGQEEEWKPRSDQLCVSRKNDDTESLLFVIEYKAAHKLTAQNLRVGLQVSNFWEEVVQVFEIPTDRDEKLVYNAKQVTGAGLTQAFDYMIKEGVEYGCLTTGEAIVLLRVKEDDPTTLYYHLSEPVLDVKSHKEHGSPYSSTAIASILGLCFLALSSPQRDLKWRREASSILNTWKVDMEYVLAHLPTDEKNSTPPASEYIPSSPVETPVNRRQARHSCAALEAISQDPSPESSDDNDPRDNTTPSKKQRTPPKKRTTTVLSSHPPLPPGKRQQQHPACSQKPAPSYPTQKHKSKRHILESLFPMFLEKSNQKPGPTYCTQKCLSGLATKSPLDRECPNISLHESKSDNGTHPISKSMVAELLEMQLNDDIDEGCKALNIVGTSGALFKMTLTSYGYTFVGKGTIKTKVHRLQHEAKVYEYLNKFQGTQIPVCLGSVNLNKPFYMNRLDEIVHFLLLSWGGKDMQEAKPSSCNFYEEATRFETVLGHVGVEHGDIRPPNMLWNKELDRPMLIDFDQARLIQKKRPHKPYLLEEYSRSKKRQIG